MRRGASLRHKAEIHTRKAPIFDSAGSFPSEINYPQDGVTPMTPFNMNPYFTTGGKPSKWEVIDGPAWLYMDSFGYLQGTAPLNAGDYQMGTYVLASNNGGSDTTTQFDLVAIV